MNNLLFFVAILVFLGLLIIMYKLFGKTGLYAYVVFGTILANIQALKSIEIFTFTTTSGSVLYAATFLCTDILSEKYGKKSAQRAVLIGIATTVLWIVGTQLTLLLTPGVNDFAQAPLKEIFGMVPRISIASLIAYVISQSIDVILYHFIWKKTGNSKKGLWVRNNGSTLVSQMFDTVVFVLIAFIGVYPMNVFMQILITTYLFKAIVAILDTPFIYLARKIKPIKEDEELYE